MAVLSPELTLEEIKEVASKGPAECIVHGRLELMESEHCIAGGLLGGEIKGSAALPAAQEILSLWMRRTTSFPFSWTTSAGLIS